MPYIKASAFEVDLRKDGTPFFLGLAINFKFNKDTMQTTEAMTTVLPSEKEIIATIVTKPRSADVSRRRLGHANPRVANTTTSVPGTGVVEGDSCTYCDTCTISQGRQQKKKK